MLKMILLETILIFIYLICNAFGDELIPSSELYTIEGKVIAPTAFAQGRLGNWQIQTRIIANGGEYIGFLKSDGSFVISNVPSGSYIVEAINPDFAYEPMRVEINSKGKFRARLVNHIQTSQVIQQPYPLKMRPLTNFRYFQLREQWRITDFLFSPMVIMMVLPLLLVMVLPKLLNDPETAKEMEKFNRMKYEMPDLSEIMSSLSTPDDKQKQKAIKSTKKK